MVPKAWAQPLVSVLGFALTPCTGIKTSRTSSYLCQQEAKGSGIWGNPLKEGCGQDELCCTPCGFSSGPALASRHWKKTPGLDAKHRAGFDHNSLGAPLQHGTIALLWPEVWDAAAKPGL